MAFVTRLSYYMFFFFLISQRVTCVHLRKRKKKVTFEVSLYRCGFDSHARYSASVTKHRHSIPGVSWASINLRYSSSLHSLSTVCNHVTISFSLYIYHLHCWLHCFNSLVRGSVCRFGDTSSELRPCYEASVFVALLTAPRRGVSGGGGEGEESLQWWEGMGRGGGRERRKQILTYCINLRWREERERRGEK